MNAEAAKKLREPFPAEQIGKLPRLTCRACRDSSTKNCSQHAKTNCQTCGNYISPRHIHLDYVGHAATTDRLLQVDPEWSWHPFTVDELAGVGAQKGELWIWLTIAGTTRPGVGDGASAKERIGDAIRNGAMRFGVALDLWAKEDLRHEDEQTEKPAQNSAQQKTSGDTEDLQKRLADIDTVVDALAVAKSNDKAEWIAKIDEQNGTEWRTDVTAAAMVLAKVRRWASMSGATVAA